MARNQITAGRALTSLGSGKVLEVLAGSLIARSVYRAYRAMIASDNCEPVGFRMPLGIKDNRLVIAVPKEAAVLMPMANLVHDRMLAAMARGLGDAEWVAIARISLREVGL